MDVSVISMIVDYAVTCSRCGGYFEYTVNNGDYYFSEDQCVDALFDSGELSDWDTEDGVCPDCVSDDGEGE